MGLLYWGWDYWTGVGTIGHVELGLLDWGWGTGVGTIGLGLGLLDWGWDHTCKRWGLLDWGWDHTYLGLGLGPYMYYTCISCLSLFSLLSPDPAISLLNVQLSELILILLSRLLII